MRDGEGEGPGESGFAPDDNGMSLYFCGTQQGGQTQLQCMQAAAGVSDGEGKGPGESGFARIDSGMSQYFCGTQQGLSCVWSAHVYGAICGHEQ